MIVLVCGGRDFTDRQLAFDTLDKVRAKYPEMYVVHGAAKGADLLAEEWCKSREVPYVGVPERWGEHGKAAGMIRNRVMRDVWKPGLALRFPVV